MNNSRVDVLSGLAISLFAFIVYLTTLSPSVGTMDSGELAASAHVLGVAHPTGYPLYTLLAKGFSLLPLGDLRVIVRLNLLAALLCAAAVFLFHRLFLGLLGGRFSALTREDAAHIAAPMDAFIVRVAAATGALILAFSRTFWAQAVAAEVYGLHLVFVALVTLLFLKSRKLQTLQTLRTSMKSAEEIAARRWWYIFAYTLGLSFANHMTTVLLAPAFLFLFFAKYGFVRAAWLRIVQAAPAFVLGLSVYLYLPVRAAVQPVMNWGDPSSWTRFWNHVSGAQFREWMFSSPGVAIRNLVRFVAGLPLEFAVLPLVAAAAGIIVLRRRAPRLLWFSVLIFAATVVYAVNYDIPDIGAYFLPAYAMMALWASFGIAHGTASVLRGLRNRVAREDGHRTILPNLTILAACVAVAAIPLVANYRAVDQRDNYALEDFARNMLVSLERDALLLSDGESSFYFTASYLQNVEGVRPDVAVIGYRALGLPWYHAQLEAAHPQVVDASRDAMDVYRQERHRFDNTDGGGDSAAVAARFVEMVRALLHNSYATRPVYITPDIGPALLEGYRAAPDGLALRVFTGAELPDVTPKHFDFRPLPETSPEAMAIRTAYAAAYCYQGVYQALRGDTTAALALLRESLEVQPDFADAVEWTRRLR